MPSIVVAAQSMPRSRAMAVIVEVVLQPFGNLPEKASLTNCSACSRPCQIALQSYTPNNLQSYS